MLYSIALSLSLLSSCFCFSRASCSMFSRCNRRHILSADFARDLPGFRHDLGVDFLKLAIQLRHFRVRRSKLRAQFGHLDLRVGRLATETFQQG